MHTAFSLKRPGAFGGFRGIAYPSRPNNWSPHSYRTFLSSAAQTLHATRELPYARDALYTVIADIQSYPHFLPFCLDAKILGWSLPDARQRRWPASAELSVGWGSIKENYTSRVHCVPGSIVESLAGEAQTVLSKDQRSLYQDVNAPQSNAVGGEVFKSLRSTWTLHDVPGAKQGSSTKVQLEIVYEFQNPLYAALAGAAIPKVTGTVMEAFENRAKQVLDG